MIASVYIPLYNNISWCRTVDLPQGFHYIASDNGSTDGSAEALEERGVTVIRQSSNLGRTGNWAFCVEHFRQGDADWMKWLFTGDALTENAAEALQSAVLSSPEARLIVAEYDIVDGKDRMRWSMHAESRVFSPAESMRQSAERGNWFGSPIAHAIHRDAVVGGFAFGELPWVADMQFCMNIAQQFPVFYCAQLIGEFHTEARQYYQKYAQSQEALLQEGIQRWRAAERYREVTGDEKEYRNLTNLVEQWVVQTINENSEFRPRNAAELLEQSSIRTLTKSVTRKIVNKIAPKDQERP